MNKIKSLREERGWNQDDLGKMLNVKRAAISKYENGRIPLTDDTIKILCEIFDVTADYLIGKSEKRKPDEPPLSKKMLNLIDSYSDLNEEELDKVIEYVDFLKMKRNP